MKLQDWLKQEKENDENRRLILRFIESNEEFFNQFEDLQLMYQMLNIDQPTRQQALEVIKKFPGQWKKDYLQTGINYSLQLEGFTLRLYRRSYSGSQVGP